MTTRTFHSEDYNITIELSPRQSGKTTRLLEKALEHHAGGGLSIYITQNFHEARRIRDILKDIVPIWDDRIKVFSITNIRENGNALRNVRQGRNTKYFFDDFEGYERRPPILENSIYYSTQVRSNRDSYTRWMLDELEIEEPRLPDIPQFTVVRQEIEPSVRRMGRHGLETLVDGVWSREIDGRWVPVEQELQMERVEIVGRQRRLREQWTIEEGEATMEFHPDLEEHMRQHLMEELGIQEEDNEQDDYLERLGLGEPESDRRDYDDVPF